MQAYSERGRRFGLHMAVIGAALVCTMAGCAERNATQLPELTRTSADAMMPPAQQQKEIAELARKKAEAQAQAVRQIETQR